jgi:hypothetical protein
MSPTGYLSCIAFFKEGIITLVGIGLDISTVVTQKSHWAIPTVSGCVIEYDIVVVTYICPQITLSRLCPGAILDRN